MNIWMLKSSEPMPIVNKKERLLRMGMLAEELNKRQHNIIWFSNSFDHFRKIQLNNKDQVIKVSDNYHIYMFHAPGYKKNISISRIINHKVVASKFKKISKKLEKPDLIYVSFPTIDYAEAAVKYGKIYGVPVIVDIRDLWPDIFNHNLSLPLRIIAFPYIKLMNYKTKKIMQNAYAINATSDAILEWGLEKGNRKKSKLDRSFYIGYNKPKEATISELENIKKEVFNLSFFGTMNNQFDYDRIIDIAKTLKNEEIMINICGDGPNIKIFKEKAKDMSNIKLFGWVDREQIDYILRNSNLGFAPYKNTFDFQKSVSNKFSEYLAYGLPIVMTSEGYMKKLLEDNACGCASQNVQELCDFILEMKENEKKYFELRKNAKKLYEEKFVSEKIYNELADYIEEIGRI